MAFNESAYYANKAKQLNQIGHDGRSNWSVSDVKKAFSDNNLTAQQHYNKYGKSEGVSATASTPRATSTRSSPSRSSNTSQSSGQRFDENTYYNNKAAQLNQTGYEGRNNWTVQQVQQAFSQNGLTAQQHYNKYGRDEGVSPYAAEPAAIAPRSNAAPPRTSVSRNQTSAGQLDQILDSNSPLMQRAAIQGQQYANARGLLNSSMASEAAQGAMIDRATPLAQQDAQTYFQNSQANADRQQQEYMANLNYQNQRGLSEQQYGFQRGLNEQGYGFDMGRMQQQFNNEMQRMGYAYELDQRNVPQNYAANISAQTLQNVQAIQADPNLEPAAKQAAIKNAIDMANANLTWAEVFYNTPMPALRTPGAA